MNDDLALFLATCILVKDPDGQLFRRDSVADEAIRKAMVEAEYILAKIRYISPAAQERLHNAFYPNGPSLKTMMETPAFEPPAAAPSPDRPAD